MTVPAFVKPEEWYDIQQLEGGITLISEPFIRPFYRCNIWHIAGREHDLLVDSGLGVVSLVGQVPWLKEKPILAVASHCHFDHIGSHHEFDDRACHPAECAILTAPTSHETLADNYAVVEMFDRLPPGGFDPAAYKVLPAAPTQLVEAGDVIDLGDRHFEVLHLPGHSPGSIGLWEAATQTLFSGDAVYDGPLIDDAFHSDRNAYVETLKTLRGLPVRVVHGGHFPSFGRDLFIELIDAHLSKDALCARQ